MVNRIVPSARSTSPQHGGEGVRRKFSAKVCNNKANVIHKLRFQFPSFTRGQLFRGVSVIESSNERGGKAEGIMHQPTVDIIASSTGSSKHDGQYKVGESFEIYCTDTDANCRVMRNAPTTATASCSGVGESVVSGRFLRPQDSTDTDPDSMRSRRSTGASSYKSRL